MVFAPGAIELAPGLRKERGRHARLGLPIWGRDVRAPRVAFPIRWSSPHERRSGGKGRQSPTLFMKRNP